MRVRDMIIVGVALVFCVIAWSQDGTVSFRPAFRIAIRDTDMHVNLMPKPLLVDPEGRGKPILLASIAEGRLMRYDLHLVPYAARSQFLQLSETEKLNLVWPIIAIGAGSLRFDSPVKTAAVLTADCTLRAVELLDGKLRVLWKVKVTKLGYADPFQAAISVVPERADAEDEGMITVAVRMRDAHGATTVCFAGFNGANGALRWRYYSDSENEEDDVLREADARVNTSAMADALQDDAALLMPFPVPEATGVAGRGIQHRSTPEEQRMQGRQYDQPWTTYRQAVITALPHHYGHPWDERLQPHVFYPAKSQHKVRYVKPGRRVTLRHNRRILRVPVEDFGLLGEKLNLWRGKADDAAARTRRGTAAPHQRPPTNVLVYHGKHGMEIIHLFTGNRITSVIPLKATHTYYHDINDDNYIEAIGSQITPRASLHGDRDRDATFDCRGTIHTGAPVAEDLVYSATICDTQGLFGNLQLLHRFLDGDVRGEGGEGHGLDALLRLGSRTVARSSTTSVMPLVVQTHSAQARDLVQVERFAVFMIDTGLVTCLDPSRRRVLWRTQADAITAAPKPAPAMVMDRRYRSIEEMENMVRPYPHLAAYSLHQRRVEHDLDFVGGADRMYDHTDPYVLAVREQFMTALHTRSGRVACSVRLAEPPVGPVLVVDFNNDGTNDVIIVSETHIYGFAGGARVSSATMTALMVLMLSLLVLLFITREVTVRASGEDEYTLPSSSKAVAPRRKGLRRATD